MAVKTNKPSFTATHRFARISPRKTNLVLAMIRGKNVNDAIQILRFAPQNLNRKIHIRCRATLGRVGNCEHSLVKLGKAGRNRHKGRRPKVRGVAQNPVAHPMGGGEGRSSGGRVPCSPWGKVEKRTRKPSKASDKLIMRKRKSRKSR